MESHEVSKECIKRKKRAVHVDRHTGRLRGRAPESRPHGSLNHSFRTFLLGVLWPIVLICLVHSHIYYISESSQLFTYIS